MKQSDKAQQEIEKILAEVRSGSDEAFSLLCERFSPMMGALLSRFSRNGSAMADAEFVQEARIALYRAAHTYVPDGEVTFGLYARVCVRNALISCLRAQSKEPDLYSLDGLEDIFLSNGQEPVETLITAETVKEIYRKASAVLSAFERRVFDLYVQEASTEGMAKLLGKSEKSVRNAIHRVRTKLKAAL